MRSVARDGPLSFAKSAVSQRLNQWFHDTVSALAWSLASSRAETDRADLQPPYNDLTRFIMQQHARMGFLGTPIMAATLGFDVFGLLGGSRFHASSPEKRERQISAWRNSKIGFQRDLVRYFESLAVLELYSRQQSQSSSAGSNTARPNPASSDNVLSSPPNESSYEIVVIGSGPGGAITACLLAEAGRNVLLIEEGEYLSLESCTPFTKEEMVRKYRNGGQTVAMGQTKSLTSKAVASVAAARSTAAFISHPAGHFGDLAKGISCRRSG